MTVEGGHNSGKTYVHRVPDNTAQQWLHQIADTVKDAKNRHYQVL
jgi:hypothetical protein